MTPATPRRPLPPLRECRILEIGNRPYFKLLLPERTTFYLTGDPRGVLYDATLVGYATITPGVFWRLRKALRRGEFDLLALTPAKQPLWRRGGTFPTRVVRLLGQLLRKFRLFGVWLPRTLPHSACPPVVVVDRADENYIASFNFWLADRCRVFFKRELPPNRWNVFLHTAPKTQDVVNLRRQPFYGRILAKLRPLPLRAGVRPEDFGEAEPAKETDLFYCGDDDNATLRAAGRPALARLTARGVRVDAPEGRLEREEFLRRCRRAWLVWSPEGQGWDCWRHYEALLVGSVPVVNYPTITRYRPLRDGEHCVFYGADEDAGAGLETAVFRALADKERLRAMVSAGRAHLCEHFSPEALLRYLEAELRGRPAVDG